MLPTLLVVFALLPLQDGYLPPADPFMELNEEWETHGADFIPEALLPKPEPKESKPVSALSKPPANRAWGRTWNSGVAWSPSISSPDDVNTALCTMAGESGGDPNADNPRSSAAGLWQFLKSTWDGMVPASVTGGSYSSGRGVRPDCSTRAAAWLWYNVGPGQWNAYRRC